MNDYTAREFEVLRQTIRSRGGSRPLVVLGGLSAWAGVLVVVLAWLPNPLASVIPLVVLLATFEVVRTLHLGVERIGRYIQVFVEEDSGGSAPTGGPKWEHTAMHFGGSVPGAGTHPYFVGVFVVAIPVNFLAVVFPGPLMVELATLAVPHLAFLVWMLYCDRGMRRQRVAELARFRALKDSLRS